MEFCLACSHLALQPLPSLLRANPNGFIFSFDLLEAIRGAELGAGVNVVARHVQGLRNRHGTF
jgi:hypothetical protein